MVVFLGVLVDVWVLLKAATGFWDPGNVKVKVLQVVEKPGWVSAPQGKGECEPEERSLSGDVVPAFSALRVLGEASLQDMPEPAWAKVGKTDSGEEKASQVEKDKDNTLYQQV